MANKKFHIKSGDTVKVIAGNHKGKQGTVKEILVSKGRATIEGPSSRAPRQQDAPAKKPPVRRRKAVKKAPAEVAEEPAPRVFDDEPEDDFSDFSF